MSEHAQPEQSYSVAERAIRVARRALDIAAEEMRDSPPGIDPMRSLRAADWREARDEIDALERECRS